MIRIGKIAAQHGLSGALIFTHKLGSLKGIKKGTALFIEVRKGSRIPYFVQGLKERGGEEALLHLEDLNTLEEAKTLVGRDVWAETQLVQEAAVDSPLQFIGYKVVDTKLGSLGEIEDVYEAGPQWLAVLMIDGKEVLFPIIDAFLVETNKRARYLRVALPEGMLDL